MKLEISFRELVIAAIVFSLSIGAVGYLLAERNDLKKYLQAQHEALELVIGIRNEEAKYLDVALDMIDDLKSKVLEAKMIERVRTINPKAQSYRIVRAVIESSKAHGMDPRRVLMQIEQESSYEVLARGDDGLSRGLMQIRPSAAKAVGLNWFQDVYDLEKNIEAGVAYLDLQKRRSGDIETALWYYNGGGDPFYVERIQRRMRSAFKT